MSGSSPWYGQVSTATTTVYYRSFTDKETGAATEPEIYYNDAATGNVVKAWNGSSYYDWSYTVTAGQLATQSEKMRQKKISSNDIIALWTSARRSTAWRVKRGRKA